MLNIFKKKPAFKVGDRVAVDSSNRRRDFDLGVIVGYFLGEKDYYDNFFTRGRHKFFNYEIKLEHDDKTVWIPEKEILKIINE